MVRKKNPMTDGERGELFFLEQERRERSAQCRERPARPNTNHRLRADRFSQFAKDAFIFVLALAGFAVSLILLILFVKWVWFKL